MRNTLEIDCLIHSLNEAMAARVELEASREKASADGVYSWDYFARDEIERAEKLAADFGDRLTAFIDARVQAKVDEALSCLPSSGNP